MERSGPSVFSRYRSCFYALLVALALIGLVLLGMRMLMCSVNRAHIIAQEGALRRAAEELARHLRQQYAAEGRKLPVSLEALPESAKERLSTEGLTYDVGDEREEFTIAFRRIRGDAWLVYASSSGKWTERPEPP
ncbi:MAG: hypothetical protein ACOC7T_02505 [Planctomycetota bacterium]